MIHFLSLGVVLGLSAGFAPGPLLTLVVAETLRHGIKSGLKVALAPVLTDVPIVTVCFLLLAKLSSFRVIMGGLSLAGATFIFVLGMQAVLGKEGGQHKKSEATTSLAKGVLVNFLSPHPYLFWLTVGGPLVSRAISVDRAAPFAFVGGFYLLLIGSKMFLAAVVSRSRGFLQGGWYHMILRFLGGVLIFLSILLFKEGIAMLGSG